MAGGAANLEKRQAPRVTLDHLELHPGRMTHNLATSRHPSGDGADKAADGIDLVAVIVF